MKLQNPEKKISILTILKFKIMIYKQKMKRVLSLKRSNRNQEEYLQYF